MNRIVSVIITIIMITYCMNTALARDKISIHISGGISDYSMSRFNDDKIPGWIDSLTNDMSRSLVISYGFSMSPEVSIALERGVAIGIGLSILYGDKKGEDAHTDFDAERYDLTGFPGSLWKYKSKIHFFIPYVFVKHKINFKYLDPFVKAGFGYGFGNYNVSTPFNKYQYNSSGLNVALSLGNSISINPSSSFDLEIGYRYLKTGNLKNDDKQEYFYRQYFYDLPLDFTGPFLQSGFSFNL